MSSLVSGSPERVGAPCLKTREDEEEEVVSLGREVGLVGSLRFVVVLGEGERRSSPEEEGSDWRRGGREG